MLRLSLPSIETFNNEKEEFETIGGLVIELEHSLYTVAKWEAKYKKIFMSTDMTYDILTSYIKEMCMTKEVPDSAWICLTPNHISEIVKYINDPHTATVIKRGHTNTKTSKQISSELIYYWMFSLQIPIDCEHWHLNRLLTLIEVSSIESAPKKKMGKKETMQQQRMLNDMRRAKYGTKG